MSGIISAIKSYHEYLFFELSDGRTDNWFLMYDPMSISIILAVYLYFVTSLGPKMMKNRKVFVMTNTLLVYNFLHIVSNFHIFVLGIHVGIFSTISWKCEPIDYSDDPRNIEIAAYMHFYLLLKISELLETVFFVLRKKNDQLSFLHLYHHTSMVALSWIMVKYLPGGHAIFVGIANAFVHFFMYGYYLLSALGPKYQKYLWWKRYITTLQLAQFVFLFLHSLQLLIYDCGFPRWYLILSLPNSVFFYYLFKAFYDRNYKKTDQNENVNNAFLKTEKIH